MYSGPVLRADAMQDVQFSPLNINLQQVNALQVMLCHKRRHSGHCAALCICLEQIVPHISPAQGLSMANHPCTAFCSPQAL